MRTLQIVYSILFTGFLVSANAAESTSPVCGKNRTTQESINIGLKNASAKGTVAILVPHRFGKGDSKLRTYYAPDVTYAEAQDIGTRVNGFYWVASSIANFNDVKTGKAAGIKKLSPYDNGCSCPCGGNCYDQDNGGCFCDCDPCDSK